MAKRVCLYGILAAGCIIFGYLEHLVSLDFIAPGVKLGLANSVVLLLILKNDIKGAFAVNIVRILLSSLLFSAPSTLLFSFSAGMISTAVMACVGKFKCFSAVGFSVIGAAVHNITQLICAVFLLGTGVVYYLPFLLVSALISGILIGILSNILHIKFDFKRNDL